MMPDMDGFDVVRRMRGEGATVPVLFLTARDATEDKVPGSPSGATTTSPSRSASRRSWRGSGRCFVVRRATPAPASSSVRLVFADIELDDDTHEVWKAGELVALSPTEFKLLRYFMQNAGRVLSKAQILDHVWHYDFGGEANVVESYVSYLRRKVDTTEPRLLHTLRGVGYVLRVPRG